MEQSKIPNNQSLGFGEYLSSDDPQKRELAFAWSTAIGLQAVDGLTVSDYLKELARKNIEGELSMDEVQELLRKRYNKSSMREYSTYTRIDHVDPIESKMGRPI